MSDKEYTPGSQTPFGVYISEYDGWDYKFPLLPPIRLGSIAANASSGDSSRATGGTMAGFKYCA